MTTRFPRISATLLTVLTLIGCGEARPPAVQEQITQAPAQTAAAVPPRSSSPLLGSNMPSLAPVVSQTAAGVVNISTLTRGAESDNPMFADPFFRRFFGVPDRPQQREAQASGS
ncbi:MAG: hypothetical protein EAZ24_08600, partial [Burkholderiales bacterium]